MTRKQRLKRQRRREGKDSWRWGLSRENRSFRSKLVYNRQIRDLFFWYLTVKSVAHPGSILSKDDGDTILAVLPGRAGLALSDWYTYSKWRHVLSVRDRWVWWLASLKPAHALGTWGALLRRIQRDHYPRSNEAIYEATCKFAGVSADWDEPNLLGARALMVFVMPGGWGRMGR